jgi:hypothetical protein
MMGVYPAASSAQAASARPAAAAASAPSAATLRALNAQGQKECLQPPAKWNVAALTDEQLALYGLPTHQVMNHGRAVWAQMFTHYKHRSCGTYALPPGMKVKDFSQFKPDVTSSVGNWAGNYAYGTRGQFQSITGEFTLPDADVTSGPAGAEVSFWAGLGGVLSPMPNGTSPVELIQAGITTTIETGYLDNWAWYEAINPTCGSAGTCPAIGLNLPDMYPGDSFSAYVSSNQAGSDINTYEVCNDTYGICNIAPENGSYTETDLSDSNNAECIGEEPDSSTGSSMVFGTEDVSVCYTTEINGDTYAVGAINHDYQYIDDDGIYVGVDPTYDGGSAWDLPSSWL